MDFELAEEDKLLKEKVRELCDKVLAPRATEIDRNKEIPKEVIKAFADAGIYGMTIPEKYNGTGASFLQTALAIEQIARADMSMATAVYFLVTSGWSYLLSKYGTEEARSEILPNVVRGDYFVGISSTEPSGGSDFLQFTTTMKREGGSLIVRGEKAFVSGLREAQKYGGGHITVTRTDPRAGHKGFTLCYIPVKNNSKVKFSVLEQMGREGISTGIVTYEDVELPERYVVGEWNKGFYAAMVGFNCARPLVAAACIGAAERALEMGIDYVKSRVAFGIPIGKFEGIQFPLVEDYTKLEMARLLVYKAAWMVDRWQRQDAYTDQEISKIVAMSKLIAPETALDIIKDVMVWHGAYSYMREMGLEMGLRGVMSYVLGAEGASNIMKIVLAREILGREFIPYER